MSFFMQKLIGKAAPIPVPVAAPISPSNAQHKNRENPFMVAMNRDSKAFKDTYGVNQPLTKPMFLGYKDNKPIYGGSQLFILY